MTDRHSETDEGGEDGPGQDVRGAVIRAAMDLAAEGGWRGADLASIAAEAGVDAETAKRHFRTKISILEELSRRIDGEVDEQVDGDLQDNAIPIRERLFEVLMLRVNLHDASHE